MQAIDAHQHFWKFDPVRDSWINDDMAVIRKDFMPEDLHPILKANDIDGCIVVQSDQSQTENDFQLSNADQHKFVKGVVGWVDFQAADVEDQLSRLSQHKKLKGFRHILQGEKQRDFMLRPSFKKGIGLLQKYNFTYDVLVFPDQLKYTEEFIATFPDQPFVIDHIAKPNIKDKSIDAWKKDMEAIGKHENVSCKISGMVTEADLKNWKEEDFTPYLDVVVDIFGPKRIMYGSDWPVCLLAGSYERTLGIVKKYFSSFSKDERDLFFGGNATKFYGLEE